MKMSIVLKDKWTSILYHIRNIHNWSESNSAYSSCAHGPLTDREEVAYKWLSENTPAYEALKSVVLDKQLLNDLLYLYKFKHSGNIEVYHGLLCKYCPRLSFSYEGMYARTQLAVLDHNCGINRKQAVTKSNQLRNKSQYTKTTGQWVPKKIMEPKVKSYISEILEEMTKVTITTPELNEKLECIPKNIAPIENPGTEKLLMEQLTRFRSKK